MDSVEKAIDALYALPLEEFVTARNALAGRLRKDGDGGAANEVKRLPKPAVAAWTLNHLARQHRGPLAALFEAGQELRKAQHALLAGRGREAFASATRAEREAVGQLLSLASSLVSEAGHGAGKTLLDRIELNLHAAAASPEQAEALRAGQLAGDLQLAGFGDVDLAGLTAPIPFPVNRIARSNSKRPAPAEPAAEVQDRLRAAREAVQVARTEVEALRQRLSRGEIEAAAKRQAAHDAGRAASAARRAFEQAEAKSTLATRAFEQATDHGKQLSEEVAQAAGRLRVAEAALKHLRHD